MSNIFVISGPSGSGKTSILKDIKKKFPDIYYSVSATTRARRKGEKDGEDYIFLSREKFNQWIKEGNFVEYARVFNDYYGTPKSQIMDAIDKGRDVLIDVDVKGAKNIKKVYPDAIMIFILPPGLQEIKRRLERRKTEGEKTITLRLEIAKKELKYLPLYDYIVLNDDLKNAVNDTISIIEFEKNR